MNLGAVLYINVRRQPRDSARIWDVEMSFDQDCADPFVARDKIPRTPPAAVDSSLRLSSISVNDSPNKPRTSMFQVDENRPKFFIKLIDSPRSR